MAETPDLQTLTTCSTCRTKKIRCDSEKPTCTYCSRHGLECLYANKSVKRGPPKGFMKQVNKRVLQADFLYDALKKVAFNCKQSPSSAVNQIGLDLEHILEQADSIDNSHDSTTWKEKLQSWQDPSLIPAASTSPSAPLDSKKRKLHSPILPKRSNTALPSLSAPSNRTSASSVSSSAESSLLNEIDMPASSNDGGPGLTLKQHHSEEPFVVRDQENEGAYAHANGLAFLLDAASGISPNNIPGSKSHRQSTGESGNLDIILPGCVRLELNVAKDLEDALFRIYFENIHPIIPIVRYPSFLQTVYASRANPKLPPPCYELRYAILAAGAFHVRFSPALQPKGMLSTRQYFAAALYTCYARYVEIQDGQYHSVPTIGTVQASIILILLEVFSGRFYSAYQLLYKAIAIAHDLCLHVDPSLFKSVPCNDQIEAETRRRVWHCLVITEEFVTLNLGRPSLLLMSRYRVHFPSLHEPDEKATLSSPWLGSYTCYAMSVLRASCQLTLLGQQHSLRVLQIADRQISFGLLRQDLTTWLQSLPSYISVRQDRTTLPPNLIWLYNRFYTSQLCFLRPYIGDPMLSHIARSICLQAADAILDLAEYSPIHDTFFPGFAVYHAALTYVLEVKLGNLDAHPKAQRCYYHCCKTPPRYIAQDNFDAIGYVNELLEQILERLGNEHQLTLQNSELGRFDAESPSHVDANLPSYGSLLDNNWLNELFGVPDPSHLFQISADGVLKPAPL